MERGAHLEQRDGHGAEKLALAALVLVVDGDVEDIKNVNDVAEAGVAARVSQVETGAGNGFSACAARSSLSPSLPSAVPLTYKDMVSFHLGFRSPCIVFVRSRELPSSTTTKGSLLPL